MKETKQIIGRGALCLLLVVSLVFSVFGGFFASLFGSKAAAATENQAQNDQAVGAYANGNEAIETAARSHSGKTLIPGGIAFGVKFYTAGVMVIGFDDVVTDSGRYNPAFDAGIRAKDVITKIDGTLLGTAAQLTEAVENSAGKEMCLTYKRDGKEYTATLTPKYSESDGRYKTGLWVRDSGAGIGTVTYIDPETLAFGGLGHGICDSETGALIPMDRGTVLDVTIGGIEKGLPGAPGEVKGYFSKTKCGTLCSNTTCGVFGSFGKLPRGLRESAMPIGTKGEIHDGDAYIWCTLDETGPQKYAIRISEINRSANGNKCFTVTVTDKKLIEKTGGIVQGMSGSPIIQDGKLVGAVTHVLINDPTKGYGIFIENMLDQMGDLAR